MGKHTPIGYLNAHDKNLAGQLIMHSVEAISVKIHDGPQDHGEAVYLHETVADMADELDRQKALIAIYERDRTRHLRSIEGADKDLAELGESLGEEIERLRVRLFSVRQVEGSSHNTACSIWGDDGQGGTKEGFKPHCNCGALTNFAKEEIERLEARVACRIVEKVEAEAQRDELRGTAEWVMDWLASFSMPPTSTIEEKQVAMTRLGAAIEKATP